jgi:hypothetical protein
MRMWLTMLLISQATALAGCTGAVATTIGDRSVTATTMLFSYARLRGSGDAATISLGGKTLQIGISQITWAGGGCLPLPAKWSRLDLEESLDSIVVRVDGRKLAAISPG